MKLNKTKGVLISAIGCTLALISIYRVNFIVGYYDLIRLHTWNVSNCLQSIVFR